jgi:catechol 2,3-dioxygenase-like lactoylglutathione lyase family enzyme
MTSAGYYTRIIEPYTMKRTSSRRKFIGAAAAAAGAAAQIPGSVRGFDHVALPMQNTEAMLAFYRALGFEVRENRAACSVYVGGGQMINFHRPSLWQDSSFTLRAPSAKPPCGDLCFVWDGAPAALQSMLDRAGAKIVEGPVARQGGRQKSGTSTYVRDPDGNLLEFIIY